MTTCITCNVTILPFLLSFHASNFISILNYLPYLYSNYNGGIETKTKNKRRSKFMRISMLLKKQSLKVCKPSSCRGGCVGIPKLMVLTILEYFMLGAEGMLGHPQAYGFHQSLDDSQFGVPSFPVKKFNTKTLPFFFCGVTLVA